MHYCLKVFVIASLATVLDCSTPNGSRTCQPFQGSTARATHSCRLTPSHTVPRPPPRSVELLRWLQLQLHCRPLLAQVPGESGGLERVDCACALVNVPPAGGLRMLSWPSHGCKTAVKSSSFLNRLVTPTSALFPLHSPAPGACTLFRIQVKGACLEPSSLHQNFQSALW